MLVTQTWVMVRATAARPALAAKALVDWLGSDPTGSGDPDFIIMGDLNSYAQEDTIDEIKAGSDDTVGTNDDFTNLILHFHDAYAYSYTFDGQAGYLDHASGKRELVPADHRRGRTGTSTLMSPMCSITTPPSSLPHRMRFMR